MEFKPPRHHSDLEDHHGKSRGQYSIAEFPPPFLLRYGTIELGVRPIRDVRPEREFGWIILSGGSIA